MIVYLRFTSPDGHPIYIKSDAVVRISRAIESRGAEINLSNGTTIYVRETVDEVVKAAQVG